jgi:hypothetical protein
MMRRVFIALSIFVAISEPPVFATSICDDAPSIFYGCFGTQAIAEATAVGPPAFGDFDGGTGPVAAIAGGNLIVAYAQPGKITMSGQTAFGGFVDGMAGFLEGMLVSGTGGVEFKYDVTGSLSGSTGCGGGSGLPCSNMSYRVFYDGGGSDAIWSGLKPVLGPYEYLSTVVSAHGLALFGDAAAGGGFDYSHTGLVTVLVDPGITVLGTTSGESLIYRVGSLDPFQPPKRLALVLKYRSQSPATYV